MDDDDLFAVFDSESSKSQQVVIPQEEDDAKPKLDPNAVVTEICGSIKRPSDNTENSEEVGSKKFKNDAETTLMTGRYRNGIIGISMLFLGWYKVVLEPGAN